MNAKIPYVSALREVKSKNVIRKGIEEFLNNIRYETTQDEFEVTKYYVL